MAKILFSSSSSPPHEKFLNGNVQKENVEKGTQEAETETVKKQKLDKSRLENLVNTANRIIAQASAIFPFELFPTTIIVEDTRITVIFRSFFAVSEQHTVDIKDVTNVFVGNGPIFGSLEIVSRTFTENHIHIKRLWRKDAVKIRNTIEGLRTIARQQIDTTNIEKEDLMENIEKINKTAVTI